MHHRQKQKQQLQQRVSCSTCGIHNSRNGDRTVGCALSTSSAIQGGASTQKPTANLTDQSSRSLAATAVQASTTSKKRTAAATLMIVAKA